MDVNYDVIIIGAGPGGLKCAETLSNSNLKILLLEKNEVIGPKICAGGLTALDKNFKIPKDKTLEFDTQYIILNDKKHSIKLKTPIKTISRYDLGQYQLSLISNKKNISIKTKTLVKEINENYIITNNNEKYYFKYLVGADGSNSIVRKYLKLENEIYMGLQYIIPTNYDNMVWFLEPKLIKSGYGWIFPHKDFISVGVFYNRKYFNTIEAKEILHKFLDKNNIDYSKGKLEGAPTNCKYEGIKFNNVFLIGDAAGLVIKNTGEGIAFAITSGGEVAKSINNEKYNFKEIKKILKYKKRHEFILKIFDIFPFMQSIFFKIFIFLMRFSFFQKYVGAD